MGHQEDEPPEHLSLKVSEASFQEPHSIGGEIETSLIMRAHNILYILGPGTRAIVNRSLGHTNLLVLESFLERQKVAAAHLGDTESGCSRAEHCTS